jgi:hypothetical protein
MATGKPLIYSSLTITDTGNDTDSVTVDLTLDDNITVSNEVVESLVEGGQTVTDFFNQSMEVMSYDLDLIDGTTNVSAYVQTNSTIADNLANIVLNGESGSVDITIANVRVSAMRPFSDLNRDHVMIKATKSSTTGITVADA